MKISEPNVVFRLFRRRKRFVATKRIERTFQIVFENVCWKLQAPWFL